MELARRESKYKTRERARRYSVSDGRLACGVVVVSARGTFTAIDRDGIVIGRYSTLREAATALPDGGAR